MAKSHHVIISGTGRAGTTLIMRILTDLGLSTGFPKGGGEIDSRSLGGLEWSLKRADAPYIVKSPWLCHYLDEVINDRQVIIDHAFIPVRDLAAATSSRCEVAAKAVSEGDKPTAKGGLWLTDDPNNQAEILAIQFHRLFETLARYDIPTTLLYFPLLAEDPYYLYEKLQPLVKSIAYYDFYQAFRDCVRQDLIRTPGVTPLYKLDGYDYLDFGYSPVNNISLTNPKDITMSLPSNDMLTGYNFIDFGCSTGGNIRFIQNTLHDVKGFGIDIDPRKIEEAKLNGHEVVLYDILKIPDNYSIEFVTMSHFLEHLDSVNHVESFLNKAVCIANSFVHIRQPYFDTDGYLLSKGLKFYWSDWVGHKNAVSSLDFYKFCSKLLNSGRIDSFAMYGRGLVGESIDDSIIPLHSPTNSGKYKHEYGEKPNVSFCTPVYKELVVVLIIDEQSLGNRCSRLTKRLNLKEPMTLIHSSNCYIDPLD